MADAKSELLEYAYSKTVCQQRPECCQPRDIELVAWDADDTMWHITPYAIASNITGPLRLIDPDTVEAEEQGYSYAHQYETVETPKKAPGRKKKKRAWQKEFDEEMPEWLRNLPEPLEEEDQELAAIEEELIEELRAPGGPAPELSSEEALLDDVSGWAPQQQKQVDALISRYGKKRCLVTDVTEEGSIVIDCLGDLYLLTKEGQLIGSPEAEEEAKPEPAYTSSKTYSRKVTIKLLPTFRETVKKLHEKGIKSAVISLNTPGTVKRIIDAFGMGEDFIEVQDTWDNKGKKFAEIMVRNKICPCNALFVDDNHSHIVDVANQCGLALQIGKGKDIEKPIEILNYIKGM